MMTICESIFLFIPPEVFMTPAIIANRRRAFPITMAAILGSIIGGAISYMIGMWLFDSVGMFLINNFSSMENFNTAHALFIKHGALIIMLSAISPIPYKLMAICAGFMGFPVLVFMAISAIFRSARFAIVGAALWRFQSSANAIVKKYFWYLVAMAIGGAILGICLLMLI